MTEWDEVISALHGLKKLEDGWDGAGAAALTYEVWWKAFCFVCWLSQGWIPLPATATATPAGTVLLTWQIDSLYVEVEVSDRLECMVREAGNPATHLGLRLR